LGFVLSAVEEDLVGVELLDSVEPVEESLLLPQPAKTSATTIKMTGKQRLTVRGS